MQQISKPKTVHDVRGSKIRCINFIKCPLCYGCRNYKTADPNCQKCFQENKKINICNKDLHRDDLVAKMITREVIKKERVTFKSRGEVND